MDEKEEVEAEFRELLKGVAAEEQQELESMTEGGELGFKMSEDSEAEYTNLLRQSGLDVEQLELQERKDAEATEKWIAEVTPALVMGDEQQLVLQQLAEERGMSPDQSLAGEEMEILVPVGFTISDSDAMAMDLIPPSNKVCQKAYVSTCGDGWGCVGGSTSRRICVDWWYSFRPKWTKWYNAVARVYYNGYCTVKANDKWYNCKYVRADIDIRMNAHQNNWKGWSKWNVLHVAGSNISGHRRIDTARRVNYAAILRRNDRTWIRVRTCLDVYAKGNGSCVTLDFSTGSNQICAPWLYVG
ncbi:MAG: hypothetical protein C4B59_02280 [Candidatus Methanogaster sp.]|uniref:Uncharacterized protein n=1 Tax=Candidatus Methanogaster sp. TaxID=3386292 RepID=A0AC61L5F0_9EURY|nr:MAG: hypothetical protein C4B59_02280 [ANME-2 cluster archaeon]